MQPPDGRRRQPFAGPITLGLAAVLALAHAPVSSQGTDAIPLGPVVGYPSGSVVVAGGGTLGEEIWERFVSLAGGAEARIVVIPTAAEEDEFPEDWSITTALREAGAGEVTLLHTRDPLVADSDAFIAPLLEATGIWIPGGRQHRLVDAYLHTRVHEAIFHLLDRGGVVGGSSAGASILASFLIRGDPETNQRVMSEAYLEGFGVLEGAAIDQHLLARGREGDLWTVLGLYPELLGIGLDEGTALVVRGDLAEVLGESQVLIYDARGLLTEAKILVAGDRFDLGARVLLDGSGEDAGPAAVPSGPR